VGRRRLPPRQCGVERDPRRPRQTAPAIARVGTNSVTMRPLPDCTAHATTHGQGSVRVQVRARRQQYQSQTRTVRQVHLHQFENVSHCGSRSLPPGIGHRLEARNGVELTSTFCT